VRSMICRAVVQSFDLHPLSVTSSLGQDAGASCLILINTGLP